MQIVFSSVENWRDALQSRAVCGVRFRGLHELRGCVNTAVEATTLSDRACSLLAQDRFLRDHIGADDIAVVSIAGNDVALKPLLGTILNMLCLVNCCPQVWLENACGATPNYGPDLKTT